MREFQKRLYDDNMSGMMFNVSIESVAEFILFTTTVTYEKSRMAG